jgi:hypothetical protein
MSGMEGYRCQRVHRLVVLSLANMQASGRSSFCGICPQTQGEASQIHTCVNTPKVVAPAVGGVMSGSLAKTNAFIVRPSKPPMGHRATHT